MKKRFIFLFFMILCLADLETSAQNTEGIYEINKQMYYGSMPVNVKHFYDELVQVIVLEKLNEQRLKRKLEPYKTHALFDSIARHQARYMKQTKSETKKQKGKYKTTAKRAMLYGASNNVIENVDRFSVSTRSGQVLTYEMLAGDIVFKWYNSVRMERLLDNPEYNYIGLGLALDVLDEKLYLSLIHANYSSFNSGSSAFVSTALPVNTRTYGLKPYDSRACRRCDRYKAIEDLQAGLSVENGAVFFEMNDFRSFKRLIRNRKDGLAVDIVFRDQYPCNENNIVDHNKISKGYLMRRVYAKKLYKGNLYPDRKDNKIKVKLGELPDEARDNYELNLVVIKNKHVCKNISQSFMVKEEADYFNPIALVADTITLYSEDIYKPKADTTFLSFKIPFEKKKYDYKREDIEPFLKLLNEPEFIINQLTIYAYSSIEGTDEENIMLQHKRAESIINALKQRQKESIITRTITGFNWHDFKQDVQTTEYSKLSSKPMEEAQEYIRKNRLQDELEPILSKHRYAQIDMKVIYDIRGYKEEKYVLRQFKHAIEDGDLPLALSIQKYIFQKYMLGQYTEKAIYEQKIPHEKEYAGLLMNQLWLRKHHEKLPLEMVAYEIDQLHKLDPDNEYIQFNKLFTQIRFDPVKDERYVSIIQNQINDLYFSTFTKKTVDALNMEFQFKIIDSLEVFRKPEKIFEESLDRIRSIYKIRGHSEDNALKLANLFIKNKDYEYATQILEPFSGRNIVSEEVIFTYLALCSKSDYRLQTDAFVQALKTANALNHNRFCKLFGGDYFSIQVFENPKIKELVCNTCLQ